MHRPNVPNAPTTANLRHAIDTGRTGDKVPYADPATAPLGTDEEAAGTPVQPNVVKQALEHELRGIVQPPNPLHRSSGGCLLAMAFLLAAAVMAVAVVLIPPP